MVDARDGKLAEMLAIPLAGRTLAPDGAGLVIAEWTDKGGGFIPPRYIAPPHIHYEDDESWYVLSGTLAFRLDGQEVMVPAGAAVTVPRGVAHTWWNPAPEPARYLIIMTARLNELIGQLHVQALTGEAMRELFRRYHSELVDEMS